MAFIQLKIYFVKKLEDHFFIEKILNYNQSNIFLYMEKESKHNMFTNY